MSKVKVSSSRRPVCGPRLEAESLESRTLMSVMFQKPTYLVSDTAGAAQVTLVRYTGFGSEKVEFSTSDSTAIAGVDYLPVQQSVVFQDGETSKQVTIPVMHNATQPGEHSVNLTITNPAPAPTVPGMPTDPLAYTVPGFVGSTAILSIVNRTDLTPPTITSSQFLTQGRKITGIKLTFSEPMDPATVQDVSNYDVRDMGARPIRTSRWTPPVDPGPVPIKSATYDTATNSVTLTPADHVRLSPRGVTITNPAELNGPYSMPTASRITDAAGNRIDGSGSGMPDGYFYATVTRRPFRYPGLYGPRPTSRITIPAAVPNITTAVV